MITSKKFLYFTRSSFELYKIKYNALPLTYPMTGTFASDIIIFEVDLIPISRIALAGGPTKMTPFCAHISANSTFSDKNPYLKIRVFDKFIEATNC